MLYSVFFYLNEQSDPFVFIFKCLLYNLMQFTAKCKPANNNSHLSYFFIPAHYCTKVQSPFLQHDGEEWVSVRSLFRLFHCTPYTEVVTTWTGYTDSLASQNLDASVTFSSFPAIFCCHETVGG